jgi:hypothetical protein
MPTQPNIGATSHIHVFVVYTLDLIIPTSCSFHLVSYVISAFVLDAVSGISNVINRASIIKRCDSLRSADCSLVGPHYAAYVVMLLQI